MLSTGERIKISLERRLAIRNARNAIVWVPLRRFIINGTPQMAAGVRPFPKGVPLLLWSGAASYRSALRATCAPLLTPLGATCAPLLTPRTGRRRGRLGLSII